ncbi:O-succinylhomoserine sulfhydrylase [Nereida ignava]|uniref:O-succinylhomoserine sulfhydrylase n=1 Tax=Nereida ignava TaxID=282199 RepID=A0A0U1NJC7_9RHOB|nr:O-succinylhomoserine sulfhydrylase [Nereida ignava]CRK74832.1 O-succinylhomoserine sulfhydrylase [Nereida ignava]SFJ62516.1 O-succinylhomoserine sulfhydrylase [Nereida ignava DSM 16309]
MTKKHPRTAAVHAGTRRSQYGELSEAMFLTQGFVYPTAEAAEARFVSLGEDEFIYARYGNPTVRMFEERIAAIEGTEDAFATASGMAAVNGAVMAGLKAGDHIVAARALFGSCLYILDDILPRFGVEVTLIDGTDLNAWEEALRPDTKMAFFETVSNPALEVIDIAAVSKLAHAVGAYVVVDNVFSTPVFSDAVAQGADVVVYSATKHIDGQGRVLGGVVLGSRDYIRKTLEPYLKHTGGAMSPFNAWTLLKGLETMDLRVRAQTQSALEIAKVLEGDARLERVIYPGLPSHPQHDICMKQLGAGGTVLAIDVRGGKDASYAMLNALEVFTISNNLGDAKSIVTPPAFTTHQRLPQEQKDALGITEGLVRISVGLEHTADLIADLEQALAQI